VRREEAGDFASAAVGRERDFAWLRATHPIGIGWMSQDLNDFGAMGDASVATAEKGEACADYGATAFLELLADVDAFDLERLGKGPLGGGASARSGQVPKPRRVL